MPDHLKLPPLTHNVQLAPLPGIVHLLDQSIVNAASFLSTWRSCPKVSLESSILWSQFHHQRNEMILTRNGRCFFPLIRFNIANLLPNNYYSVILDIIPLSESRYKFRRLQWVPESDPHGKMQSAGTYSLYINDRKTQSGNFWNANGASFNKAKCTNNNPPNCNNWMSILQSIITDDTSVTDGLFHLNSFHLYQPRLHIMDHGPENKPYHSATPAFTFVFEMMQFISVTHYQNQNVNRLKKLFNPHAKGFKDDTNHVELIQAETGNVSCHRTFLEEIVKSGVSGFQGGGDLSDSSSSLSVDNDDGNWIPKTKKK